MSAGKARVSRGVDRSGSVYSPNFEIGMTRLAVGNTSLKKQLSRERMPTGKIAEVPNLIMT